MTCATVEISEAEYDRIKDSEAVVLCEYERQDGSRFANLVMIGDLGECQIEAETPRIVIVREGLKVIGTVCVKTSDLLPPDETR